MEELGLLERTWSRVAAHLHKEDPAWVAWASGSDAYWMPLWGEAPGIPHLKERL